MQYYQSQNIDVSYYPQFPPSYQETHSYQQGPISLLKHSASYARKVLGEYIPQQSSGGGSGLSFAGSRLPSFSNIFSAPNRGGSSFTYTGGSTYNIGSNNGNSTTYRSDRADSEESRRSKQRDNENTLRIVCGIAAVVIAGVAAYLLAQEDRNIVSTRKEAHRMMFAHGGESQLSQLAYAADPTQAAVKFVAVVHVRMLDREHDQAKYNRLKAITMIAGAAIMGTGAVFGSILAIKVSVCAIVILGIKHIYDYFRDETGEANREDAHHMLSLISQLRQEDQRAQNAYLQQFQGYQYNANNYMHIPFPTPSAPPPEYGQQADAKQFT